jgi:hypothetical protein
MQVLFTISKLSPIVTEECMFNVYNVLCELSVVWHTISCKQGQTLGMSPVEIRGDVESFSNAVFELLK